MKGRRLLDPGSAMRARYSVWYSVVKGEWARAGPLMGGENVASICGLRSGYRVLMMLDRDAMASKLPTELEPQTPMLTLVPRRLA